VANGRQGSRAGASLFAACLAIALAIATPPASAQNWSYFISPPASLEVIESDLARHYPDVANLTPAALSGEFSEGGAEVLLLDVREPGEFAVSRLAGAIQIEPSASASEVVGIVGARARGRIVVLYCSVGQRSSAMARRAQTALRQAGAVEVVNLQGGIFSWRNAGLPVVSARGATPFVHPYNRTWSRYLQRQDLVAYTPR
jgi:rhodanese-related sulfurtransferase